MRTLSLTIFSLFIFGIARSQSPVVDTHPAAQIFAINYQTGQEIQVGGDQAILFKDAFVDLVSATFQSRQILRSSPGRKVAVIKQIDPQKLNGYQLTWQAVFMNQTRVLCTFYYNITENALYFFDPQARNWVNIEVTGGNVNNLNNCQQYAKFNEQQGVPDLSANGNNNSQPVPDLSANGGNDQQQGDNQAQGDDAAQLDADISAAIAPPALPEYEQPPCPVDGYLWQPGYWAYSRSAADYYWVPGVWVAPPRPNYLWTPCYWGFVGGVYMYHPGYWGLHVGFYGGINYGFGYVGVGFVGGEWHGGAFRYNTAVVRVNTTVVHNTYVNNTVVNNTTVNNTTVNRSSFNGQGGVTARPTPQEQAATNEQHLKPTTDQVAHQQAAVNNKSQFASANKGRPAVTTMAKVNPPALNPRGNNGSGNQPGGNKTPGNSGGNPGGAPNGNKGPGSTPGNTGATPNTNKASNVQPGNTGATSNTNKASNGQQGNAAANKAQGNQGGGQHQQRQGGGKQPKAPKQRGGNRKNQN